jgi:pyruvate dehydrogenase E1 component beta subunit/2-oxoisovalerate dehydrogenase E1 component
MAHTTPLTITTDETLPDAAHARALLWQMIRIRRFEEKCAELYSAGKIRGFLHLYVGEEAIAAGAMPLLAATDNVLATYREHGHALARGLPAGAIMAEMYGKAEGCSRGRGGSMHLFDASRRFFGGNAIVGGALPLAVGFALADKLAGRDAVTACFFGEGAMAEGEFHESANLAALWKLPVLFLCENNLYAMGTALARSQSQTDLAARARIYHMCGGAVDGMDVLAVERGMRAAVDYVRSGHGPAFLEFRTYRFRAHSMFDPELYRDKNEVERWKARCPIDGFARRLVAAGVLAESVRDDIEREVAAEIDAAVAFAEAGSWEPVEALARDVYARAPYGAPPPQRGSGVSSGGEAGEHGFDDAGRATWRDDGGAHARAEAGSGHRPDEHAAAMAQRGHAMRATKRRITYRDALREGLRAALLRDERVFLIGEDVGRYGGTYAVSRDLLAEFGEARIRDAPLSESAFVGAGIGAAINGMRPIVEIMTVNFSLLALDQIINNAATLRHMSGGQFDVPVVIRMTTGGGRQLAAQHSHSLEGWYAHIPGLRIVAPATHDDARGMVLAALDDPDPVLIFEHALLLGVEGELSEPFVPVDIDRAAVRRAGGDVSLITYGGMLHKTLGAAAELAGAGIDAEVLDLRSLRPLDDAAIVATVSKTRRAVVIDEGWKSGSLAAEIVTRIVEQAFYELDAPLARVCSAEVPVPYPKHLEDAAIPQVTDIVAAVRRLLQ